MTPCDQLVEFLAEQGRADLPQDLAEHLGACRECTAMMRDYAQLLRDLTDEPQPLDPEVEGELVHNAMKHYRPPVSERSSWMWLGVATAAAALLILFPSAQPSTTTQVTAALSVEADAGSRWRAQQHAGTTWLLLREGYLRAALEPGSHPLKVWTPGGTVAVVGTVFEVGWRPTTNQLQVAVEQGEVRVEPAGTSGVTLTAGQNLARTVGTLQPVPEFQPPVPTRTPSPPLSPSPPPPPPPAPAKKPRPKPKPEAAPVPVDHYGNYEAAMAKADYTGAARHLDLGLKSPDTDAFSKRLMRLEKAKLNLDHLDQGFSARLMLRSLADGDDAIAEEARRLLKVGSDE